MAASHARRRAGRRWRMSSRSSTSGVACGLVAKRRNDLLEESQILRRIFRRRLRRSVLGDDPVKLFELVGVGVFEGGARDALGVGVADRLADDQGGGEV